MESNNKEVKDKGEHIVGRDLKIAESDIFGSLPLFGRVRAWIFGGMFGMRDPNPPKTEQIKRMMDQKCELCGGHIIMKEGHFGAFLGCSNYPTCKNTKAISFGIYVYIPPVWIRIWYKRFLKHAVIGDKKDG